MGDSVLVEIAGGVGTLVLNRPQVLNALDVEMAAALDAATRALAADAAVRCVVVRGAGDHFMAGGDVGYFRRALELAPGERRAAIAGAIVPIHEAIRTLASMPKPVVASVRGACAGFGVSLMAACDLAIVAEDAVLSLAYCRIGATPDGGSTWHLPRVVGLRRALELALLGDRFTAADALAMGLASRVVAPDRLDEETAALAARLVAGPAEALVRTRALLRGSTDRTLDEQLAAEEDAFLAAVTGAEFDEGVRAFVEKRPPRFT